MKPFPLSELLVDGIFVVALGTTIVGALIAALSPRIIRSVCGLAFCSFGLAGLYYLLHSPFLALMEILIYVGAVCVTIVFAVMLAEPDEPAPEQRRRIWGVGALVVCGAILWGLLRLTGQQEWALPLKRVNDGSIKAVGISLITTYSMAFELISLALLVAIVGALAIARAGRDRP